MPASIETNAKRLLEILDSLEADVTGEAWVSGSQLQESSNLSPSQINDAIVILRERGVVEWRRYLACMQRDNGAIKGQASQTADHRIG